MAATMPRAMTGCLTEIALLKLRAAAGEHSMIDRIVRRLAGLHLAIG